MIDTDALFAGLTPDSPKAWSTFQQEIFETAKLPGNLAIQAVAGSGKTTTLIEATNHAPGSSLFLAFNKAIAEDIRSKAPSGDVKTLNALGHKLWMENRRGAQLDANKTKSILYSLLDDRMRIDYAWDMSRIIGLMKNTGLALGGLDPFDVEDIIEAYDFDIPLEMVPQISQWCVDALEISLADEGTFDFDDQLLIPVLNNWTFPSYNNAFCDEAQDLNAIQHAMLEALAQQGARIIGVGDTYQAIYGFRGAMSDSMQSLKRKFSMKELPLSISYRCDNAIINEAQAICPHIQARTNAGPGSVQRLRNSLPQTFIDELIICRNNAPLFREILKRVRAKQPMRVLSNFMTTFQTFVRNFKCRTTFELRQKLDLWYDKEIEAAKKKGAKSKMMLINDKYDTLVMFCEEYTHTTDILDVLKRLGEGRSGPTFSTVHKAKGLEAERVFILRPDLIPSQWAETPEARQQEMNLLYVAITRAKHSLTYGPVPGTNL